MTAWRLLADVGGTNVRFARATSGTGIIDHRNYPVVRFECFSQALGAYLDETGAAKDCSGAAIGAAGPVIYGTVKITNTPWRIEARDVSRQLAGAPVRIVNDLEAVALALPLLPDTDLKPIGGAALQRDRPRTMLAVNIGTGFGAAAVIPCGNGYVTSASEAGHMSLGLTHKAEFELLEGLESVESLLSGRGLTDLYNRLADGNRSRAESPRSGAPFPPSAENAAEVIERYHTDPAAGEAIRLFVGVLGRIAGDLALASAAWGGVFLCGGVVQGWNAQAGTALFRQSFERKGAMRERMEQIFTGIILREDASLYGLCHLTVRP